MKKVLRLLGILFFCISILLALLAVYTALFGKGGGFLDLINLAVMAFFGAAALGAVLALFFLWLSKKRAA